ncbi:MAG: hypothetical protein Q4F29_04425 [Lachnospiraceae bacterium]|nr:hypothetical protein [Lachnospiraceae bacterium]
MKAVVVEVREASAVVLSDDGIFTEVKNRDYRKGQVIIMKEKKRNAKKMAVCAACAAVLCAAGGTGVWAYTSPYSYVSLDVNPSIEYTLNRFDKVLKVRAVNDDGERVLARVNLDEITYQDIEEALLVTIDQLVEDEFFQDGEEKDMVISTSGKSDEKAEQLAQRIENKLKEENPDDADDKEDDDPDDLHMECFAVGRERVEEAKNVWHTTPGRLNLIQKLIASRGDEFEDIQEEEMEELLKMPVKDIMEEVNENRKNAKAPAEDDDTDKEDQTEEDETTAADEKENEKAEKKAELEAEKAKRESEREESKAVKESEKEERLEEKADRKTEKESEKAAEKKEKDENKKNSKNNGKGQTDAAVVPTTAAPTEAPTETPAAEETKKKEKPEKAAKPDKPEKEEKGQNPPQKDAGDKNGKGNSKKK